MKRRAFFVNFIQAPVVLVGQSPLPLLLSECARD